MPPGAVPHLSELKDSLHGVRAWLVGGAVRDLLRGERPADLDLVIEGDLATATAAIGEDVSTHDRFETATFWLDEVRVDLARARTEHYERPGALPAIAPASIEEDLERRDFTINAMAVPLFSQPLLIDTHGGQADLESGVIRVLHRDSFADDPTRALRAAMYAARFGFKLDPVTEALVKQADLSAVSDDRVQADLLRIAHEPAAAEAFGLLSQWGLAGIGPGAEARVRAVQSILADPAWRTVASPSETLLGVATRPEKWEAAVARARAAPSKPSEIAEASQELSPAELVVARAAGATWLDDWVGGLRDVRLTIDGNDLITSGITPGPAIGRGLAAALAAKLDGETSGRDDELRVALRAAT